jgi:hypothetical protein
LLSLFSLSAFAGQNWMYCKVDGEIINLLSANGYECNGALMAGTACFTGDMARTVGYLNSSSCRALFDRTAGEYIKDVTSNTHGSVTYTTVDKVNNVSGKANMERCDNKFFLKD